MKREINIPIGQTLESKDEFLPNNKQTSKNRPVITVDKNKKGELAIIPITTQDTGNSTYYGKFGVKYYRHNLEVLDNENKPIKVGKKFQLNKNCTKLPLDETLKIRDKVLNHTKFSSVNRQKYIEFQNRNKKSRD